MEAKLYVGNLSYGVTEQRLRELFMQAGNVNSVALVKEFGTQQSKGFAFVEMGSETGVQKAIHMFNGYSLEDHQMAVSVAHTRFEIGETVVHPQHGVGQVVKVEDKEFEPGVIQRYYEISIPGGSTVWVSVDLSDSGLRGLADKREITHCRNILASLPLPLAWDGRIRQSELVAKLKQGTIAIHCEIVRDLSEFVAHKSAYGTITDFLRALQSVLCQEWAIVEGITLSEATYEIHSLLEKGR